MWQNIGLVPPPYRVRLQGNSESASVMDVESESDSVGEHFCRMRQYQPVAIEVGLVQCEQAILLLMLH